MATLAVDNIYTLQKIATHAYRASHGAAPIRDTSCCAAGSTPLQQQSLLLLLSG
jgi:hypothetical protein